ncbi:hypothetical protein DTO021C3_6807 [Paecilomyces variotii]|nr:hypothetical protein DTO021C3_6807 [Paecilomyces variotii]KAJ9371993.1 hypothetical protein DTO282E5_3347 [Paecilomyces variotii]
MPCHRCTAVGRCHQKAIHQIPWALSNVKNLLQYDVNTRLYKTITVRLMIPRLMENWTDQWEGAAENPEWFNYVAAESRCPPNTYGSRPGCILSRISPSRRPFLFVHPAMKRLT